MHPHSSPSNLAVSTAETIVDVLRIRAAESPECLAFSFLIDGEEEGPRLTYGSLDQQACVVAAGLREVADVGDRALLMYAPGLEFIVAIFGCLYAGVVPVPVYPPRMDRLLQSWEALANVTRDCEPKVILTTRSLAALLSADSAPRSLWTDALDNARMPVWRARTTDPDALALLQYTSGSTATPKGVMVTHRSLMHNQRVMQTHVGPAGPGLGVCWLPLYHDMGLLGGVMQPLYCGTPCVMMSPMGILQKPVRWLRAITRYRAECSGAPNFAYQLCADRVTDEEKATLDLSSWSLALVGGEPISARTLERFAEAFAECGFRAEALTPCYGLAEATLTVTAARRFAPTLERTVSAAALERGQVVAATPGTADARGYVSSGRAWLDMQVIIADPKAMTRCQDGAVGEIWVGGPSVAAGYWGQKDESERTFRAHLSDSGDGPFLRTGDLGFIENGELFVTGRLKDVLVIRGRNHYPDEIERTVQAAHLGLRAGCGAAFESAHNGEPRLVIVQEVQRGNRSLDFDRLLGDVRCAVADHHGLHVHDLQLLEYGSIPKTSSGKIQRHRCRIGYEQGTLRRWQKAKANT